MRIAGAHHGAAVLEYLDVVDFFASAEFAELLDPRLYDAFNLADFHCGEGEVVARRKADNTADSRFAFGTVKIQKDIRVNEDERLMRSPFTLFRHRDYPY